jgi:hypothetical protein
VAIVVDQEFLPAIRVFHDGATTDEEFAAYLETLLVSMNGPKAGPRLLVIDATHSAATPATQRRLQADWMKQHAARIRDVTVGCAFIIPSGLVRGILTAILWIQPLPCPHEVVATLDEALAWGAQRLSERGLSIPVGARFKWSGQPLATAGARQ